MILDTPGWLSGARAHSQEPPWDSSWCPVASPGRATRGQHTAGLSQACLLGTRAPSPLSPKPPGGRVGGLLCLGGWSVTQLETHTSEWRNVACQIK